MIATPYAVRTPSDRMLATMSGCAFVSWVRLNCAVSGAPWKSQYRLQRHMARCLGESPRSPQSPGHYAAGFAMGLTECSWRCLLVTLFGKVSRWKFLVLWIQQTTRSLIVLTHIRTPKQIHHNLQKLTDSDRASRLAPQSKQALQGCYEKAERPRIFWLAPRSLKLPKAACASKGMADTPVEDYRFTEIN